MTDDRFERELRGFLAAREPAAVSPVLRARLQAVTAAPSTRDGSRRARLGDLWRAAAGIGAVVAVGVVALALLLRVDGLTVRDPGDVGGPSAAPDSGAVPFVTDTAALFTPLAVADAERRLANVFAATGVEARIIVEPQASASQILTPDGWPDLFDRDGVPDRDVALVIGIAPDGTAICCLTLVGDLIGRARDGNLWTLDSQPHFLHGDLAQPTAEFRDVALERFVRGIEEMAPRLASLESEGFTNEDFAHVLGIAGIVGPLLLLFAIAFRRRPVASIADGASTTFSAGPVVIDGAGMAPETAVSSAAPAASRGSAQRRPWSGWSDRALVRVVLLAIAGLAILGVVDLVLPRNHAPLDVTADGVGIVRVGLNLVPFALIGVALVGLITYALRGRWRRRSAILLLVAVAGWTSFVVVGHTTPTSPDAGRAWIAGDGGETKALNPIIQEVTYRLNPEERFTFAMTIRNPGVLPLTILGLDGTRSTKPNPYIASIVGLGWVIQPLDGAITALSARPEDASSSWPVTIRPGEELAIILIGDAGPCASPEGTGGGLPLMWIPVAYRVLGIEQTVEVGLPAILTFPALDPCTVPLRNGTITYDSTGQ